jgi:hypothetical protein
VGLPFCAVSRSVATQIWRSAALPQQTEKGSADVEAGLPEWVLDLHLDPVDVRARRAVVTPLHDAFDCRLGSFEHHLDPPIGEIANPPRHSERDGLLATRLPEPDPLHAPGDENPLSGAVRLDD